MQASLLLDEHLARLFLHLLQAGLLRLEQRQNFCALRVSQLDRLAEIFDVLRRRRPEHRPAPALAPPSPLRTSAASGFPLTPGPLDPRTPGTLDSWTPGTLDPCVPEYGPLEHDAREQPDREHEPDKCREPHAGRGRGHCTPPVVVDVVANAESAVELSSNESRSLPPTSPVTSAEDAGITSVV